jgi:hypothetical protein
MMFPFAARGSLIVSLVLFACGGDDDGNGVQPTSDTDVATSTSNENDTSSSSSDGDDSTGPFDGTTGDESSDAEAESTGDPSDPSYPPVGPGGTCPEGASVMLPGASVCAPFCAGARAACPEAATGTAVPTCTPFEMEGGSGTPCRDHDDCPEDEACGVGSTCMGVSFWGCRLECEAGAQCPDAMICSSVGACGYPQ